LNPAERREKTIHLFRNNFNCAQSVFSVYGSGPGINEKTARAVGAGFGGGMGALQKTCGAVTGGIMAIGGRFFDEKNLPASKMLVRGMP
jgi:C_GCAxxG_C_C family probable redox protein